MVLNLQKTQFSPTSGILRTLKKGSLRVTRKVLPGRPGAVRELKRYGPKLMAIRYLKDDNGRYAKTVEILVYERFDNTNRPTRPTTKEHDDE